MGLHNSPHLYDPPRLGSPLIQPTGTARMQTWILELLRMMISKCGSALCHGLYIHPDAILADRRFRKKDP